MPKKIIRIGVWETRSSSTHSLTIADKEDYKKWQEGRLLLDFFYDRLVTEEQAIEEMKADGWFKKNLDFSDSDAVQEALSADYWTFERYEDHTRSYYTFENEHTTPSGDKIVVFGYYGETF